MLLDALEKINQGIDFLKEFGSLLPILTRGLQGKATSEDLDAVCELFGLTKVPFSEIASLVPVTELEDLDFEEVISQCLSDDKILSFLSDYLERSRVKK